jgi:hypothetical protein
MAVRICGTPSAGRSKEVSVAPPISLSSIRARWIGYMTVSLRRVLGQAGSIRSVVGETSALANGVYGELGDASKQTRISGC